MDVAEHSLSTIWIDIQILQFYIEVPRSQISIANIKKKVD